MDRVRITSAGSVVLAGRLDEKRESNASVLEVGGTEAVMEMGLWMEKNDATWTSAARSG